MSDVITTVLLVIGWIAIVYAAISFGLRGMGLIIQHKIDSNWDK